MTDSHKFSYYLLGTFIVLLLLAFALDARAAATSTNFEDNYRSLTGNHQGTLFAQEFDVYNSDPGTLTAVDVTADANADVYICDGTVRAAMHSGDEGAIYNCNGAPVGQGHCYPMSDFATSTRDADFSKRCLIDYGVPLAPGRYFFTLTVQDRAHVENNANAFNVQYGDTAGLDKNACVYYPDHPDPSYEWRCSDLLHPTWFTLRFANNQITGDATHSLYPPGYDDTTSRWIWDNTEMVWLPDRTECELGTPCLVEYRYSDLAARAFGDGLYITYPDESFANRYLVFQYFEDRLGLLAAYPNEYWNRITIPEPVGDSYVAGDYQYTYTIARFPPDARDYVSEGRFTITWLAAGTRAARAQAIIDKFSPPGFCGVNDECGLTDVECGLKETGRWLLCPSASSTAVLLAMTEYSKKKFPLNLIMDVDYKMGKLATTTSAATSAIPFLIYGKNGAHHVEYLMKNSDWDKLGEGKIWLFRIFDYLFRILGLVGLLLLVQRGISGWSWPEAGRSHSVSARPDNRKDLQINLRPKPGPGVIDLRRT